MSQAFQRTTSEHAARSDAMAAFIRAAGDAPRLVPTEDGSGLPLFHALGALQWTGETGLVRGDDCIHAIWFHGETGATVIERPGGDGNLFRYFGPRLETHQHIPAQGRKVIDEPFVRGYEFTDRWSALAHFFVTTQGNGALVSLLSERAPRVDHVRQWLMELFMGPLPDAADHLAGCWFSETGAGFLFPPAVFADGRQRGWIYVGLGPTTMA
jgi:hypothetical protein